MPHRICPILICIAGLLCADGYGYAQEVTLSARIKVIENDRNLESLHAENVVVWLSPIAARPVTKFAPKQPMRLTQHNKSFDPHLLVVPVGAMVQFPNRDPFFHNVFSLYQGKRFDLGLYQAGSEKEVVFDRPGPSFLFCNIHPQMTAVIFTVNSDHFGISDKAGHILISHVPAGRYAMHAWYEGAASNFADVPQRSIDIGLGENTLPAISIPVTKHDWSHKDKYGNDYDPKASVPAY